MFAVRSIFSIPGRLELDINRLVQNNELPNWFIKEKNPLEFILKDSGAKSLIDACYRYARHQEGVDTVLFGTSNLNHLNKNIKSILAPKLSVESISKDILNEKVMKLTQKILDKFKIKLNYSKQQFNFKKNTRYNVLSVKDLKKLKKLEQMTFKSNLIIPNFSVYGRDERVDSLVEKLVLKKLVT